MKETKSYFIFCIGQMGLHIQKKMFADTAELQGFRNFIFEKNAPVAFEASERIHIR